MALLNSFLLAIGLAFESFVVAMANGLHNANYGVKKALCLAGLFAICHAAELLLGYALIKTVAHGIQAVDEYLTWIAVGVLAFLGIKMIAEGISHLCGKTEKPARTMAGFVLQSAVAAFDAFAAGLTMPQYTIWFVALTATILSVVIVLFYTIGFWVGKKCGTKFGKYSAILGGLVFLGLALEVVIGAV